MDLRDWLIVVGVVIIVGILLDGYRRMRLAKKDSLKMSLEMGGNIENTPLDEGFNPELPSGGARVVDSEYFAEQEKLEPQVTAEDLSDASIESSEPSFDSLSKIPELNTNDFKLEADDVSALVADSDSRIELQADGVTQNKIVEVAHAGQRKNTKHEESTEAEQLVIVLNVHSKEGSFPGMDIKHLLEACGLEHGEMSIFHRHEEDDLLSPIQFSVANAVEPGYFDPDILHEIATPGVSFFMSLPGPNDYMKAFDYMLETAQCFARNLKGDLKDQDRSILTEQTIKHCRQQIKEFERKQLSKSRA